MRSNDRGFTLIEILVAVVIGTVLTGALFQAIFVGLRTLDDTNQRIAGSNDTQLVAAYFTSDVASAESVSTTGTTVHRAPTVNGQARGALVVFWALKTETTVTPPDEMVERWDVASTGPTPSSRISLSMADQPISEADSTGDRVAQSTVGTSSIGHAVALSPNLFATVAISDVSVPSTAEAASLRLEKPPATQAQDIMLAHIAVSGGSATTVTAPEGWNLVEERASGSSMRSLVYSRPAGGSEPNWTWTFNGSHESVGSVASYSGANGVNSHGNDISPCGGGNPVLLLSWTDRGTKVAHQVSYNFQSAEGENQLARQHCTGSGGTSDDTQILARNLSATASATAACQPVSCVRAAEDSPVSVTLTLSEPAPLYGTTGRVYQLRGTTRTSS